ncbi:N-6 DNA methylase [Panacibacter ginsenosidivorans]|uniref:site-specific DNA-methyltransferase (adenine-specific) n=1 Tax=Panacibacter ginsenosidivorans TaxID=1813871 RepID=A0A5B8VE93_9BACT|nr:N-6 DNA methylase [Panacibacter ginsenosidivorans]QEC69365.1 N-6 DNA methylase [Panacibacter ginsenosidivorans]
MKYQFHNIQLSPEEKAVWNASIIEMLSDNTAPGMGAEEIYNLFTGKGGLHGLSRQDYPNYYEYATAKKEVEQGQFFTPHNLCDAIVRAIKPKQEFTIADLTCGIGNFFNFMPNESNLYGNEIDPDALSVCKHLYPLANLEEGDLLYYRSAVAFDIVIGNPPFNLATDNGNSQWVYLQKAHEVLKYGGLLCIIVPASFLADEFQDKRKISWLNDKFHFVLQSLLPADAFDACIETKLLILQKKGIRKVCFSYQPTAFVPFEPDNIYNGFIKPLYEENKANAARLHLLSIQESIGFAELNYQIKKRLWHIKSNPLLRRKFYKKALQKLDEIKTKKRPDDMSLKEWERIKPTPEKVLHWMSKLLKEQNLPPARKITAIVKNNYGIANKSYHKSLQSQSWYKSVHDLLLNGGRFAPYKKLYDKKEKALTIQNSAFTQLSRKPNIDAFLNRFRLTPKWQKQLLFPNVNATIIKLNQMQKQDLGLILQKHYSILAWEQGGGKSVAGMTWLRYWEKHYRYCFILAPALAINTTWTERLSIYGFDFCQPESASDLYTIKQGQIILVTYDRLISLQRFIKRFIKHAAYKIALLVDESDELTNASSQRSIAALNCFRKAKLKLLTTGTTTRNNINELYTQLELLYNNSSAFRCWAERIYKADEKGSIRECLNENCGYPFPAYNGAALFKASFCPQRVTVFGIRQDTQDIYNTPILKEIIDKTIVTRKFEEITGEKKYSIHTHAVRQSIAEKELYRLLMHDFLKVCYDYYTTTGNARKEAAMRLLRQIKALIKATSVPHLMPNYTGAGYPEKYNKIKQMVQGWSQELVTIGTVLKSTARDYHQYLKEQFKERQLFYIDGERNVTKRKAILEQFRLSENGLLVCTQQSLKSSVNIPYCNRCIIESLQWNIPKISQFYFRFIRFDSVRHSEVHFVNYENTIEINLLALLMAKEKLNDFIKTTNEKSSKAIYEQFGIDLNILDMLISKSYDDEGKLVLRWGKQQLC